MTRATEERPTKRILAGRDGDYVVELRASLILVRPKGTRRGGPAEIAITPSLLHQRILAARAEEERRARQKARRR
jgi:hypothetical protein